jgi:hypothetical protein
MSAVPGEFMRKPPDQRDTTRPEDASRTGWWQWLAIGALLACWVAEATLCAGQGL